LAAERNTGYRILGYPSLLEQLLGRITNSPPPICGVLLGPARLGIFHPIGSKGAANQLALRIIQGGFVTGSAQVVGQNIRFLGHHYAPFWIYDFRFTIKTTNRKSEIVLKDTLAV
jgi:hypothetical protein